MAKFPPEYVMSDAEPFDNAGAAVARLKAIYAAGRGLLREHFNRLVIGAAHLKTACARYPAVWIEVEPGTDRLSGGPLWVEISQRQIPLTFALENLTADLREEQVADMARRFNMPDLAEVDDGVANGTYRAQPDMPKPLSLFSAEWVDYSLSRLRHYSGTAPEHFQRFVLFTNYQRYVDEFI